jgi:rhomboid protease GluP
MENATAPISARSRREAMDWSLVLASQGIEARIEHLPEENRWLLLVSEAQYENSVRTIRQYQLENRHWKWRQQISSPEVLFDWSALAWVALLAIFFWADSVRNLRTAGATSAAAFWHGEWWRVFTAVWLHADLGHLGANASFGVLVLGLVMGRYGTGVGLLSAYMAGSAGNLARAVMSPADPIFSLGASGMVMACLGLLAVPSLQFWRRHPDAASRHALLAAVFGAIMLFVLFGLAPGTDVLAHSGGFVAGLLLAGFLALCPDCAGKNVLNVLCGIVFTLLVLVPWACALRTIPTLASSQMAL